MTFKTLSKLLGLIGFIFLCGFSAFLYASQRDEAEFQAQLRYARSLGIPTTPAEFAAKIPTASPAENAAPFYRRLPESLGKEKGLRKLQQQVTFEPSLAHQKMARALLASHKTEIDLVDQAARKPRCWFNRDWSKGAFVLFPELDPMRRAADLVEIRASLKAANGDSRSALQDIHEVYTIANHLNEEPTGISTIVSQMMRLGALHVIADWAFRYRDRPEYRDAYTEGLRHYPMVDRKRMHLDSLFRLLLLITDSNSNEGLRKMGIRKEDIGLANRLMPLMFSQSKARIEIAKTSIQEWKDWDLPFSERMERLEASERKLNGELIAFPVAWKLYDELGMFPLRGDMERTIAARAQIDLAISRALCGPKIPKMIVTDDLKSPYDRRPIYYRYDGRKLSIRVSGRPDSRTKPWSVEFPPDLGSGS